VKIELVYVIYYILIKRLENATIINLTVSKSPMVYYYFYVDQVGVCL
jgi:hypothetical protein